MTHLIYNDNIKDWAKNYDGPLFDGILCDPPYELGFMGKSWDSSGIAFDVEMWAGIYKLLKPGAHVLAFSGSRTYHRMAVAIEDAGFEIRDQIIWLYGQGFPKALNINKQLNTCNCSGNAVPYNHDKQSTEHELRPMPNTNISQTNGTATEQGQVLQSGVSEQSTQDIWQEPRKGTSEREEPSMERRKLHRTSQGLQDDTDARTPQSEAERLRAGAYTSDGTNDRQTTTGRGRSTSHQQTKSGQPTRESKIIREPYYTLDGESLPRCSECERPILRGEYKTALKPSHEPAVLARKPLDGTVANNVLKHGTGGLNIDGTRVETQEGDEPKAGKRTATFGTQETVSGGDGSGGFTANTLGRFPANLIHDGSDEVEAVFPQTKSGKMKAGVAKHSHWSENDFNNPETIGDSGSASRFFYTAKASKSERDAGMGAFEEKQFVQFQTGNGASGKPSSISEGRNTAYRNHHPTVKPLSLTKYLATLIKPPTGGRLLVPFSGSGSEMIGALQAGWEEVVGVELTEEYIPIAEARIKYWLEQEPKQASLL